MDVRMTDKESKYNCNLLFEEWPQKICSFDFTKRGLATECEEQLTCR